jgi:hypothetical protein
MKCPLAQTSNKLKMILMGIACDSFNKKIKK